MPNITSFSLQVSVMSLVFADAWKWQHLLQTAVQVVQSCVRFKSATPQLRDVMCNAPLPCRLIHCQSSYLLPANLIPFNHESYFSECFSFSYRQQQSVFVVYFMLVVSFSYMDFHNFIFLTFTREIRKHDVLS